MNDERASSPPRLGGEAPQRLVAKLKLEIAQRPEVQRVGPVTSQRGGGDGERSGDRRSTRKELVQGRRVHQWKIGAEDERGIAATRCRCR